MVEDLSDNYFKPKIIFFDHKYFQYNKICPHNEKSKEIYKLKLYIKIYMVQILNYNFIFYNKDINDKRKIIT